MALNGQLNSSLAETGNHTMVKRENTSGVTRPRAKLAILALVAPSAVLLFSLCMLAVINLIFNPTFWMTGDTEPVSPTPLIITVLNTLFIVTGAVGLISLLPIAAAGIYLLTRSKPRKTK